MPKVLLVEDNRLESKLLAENLKNLEKNWDITVIQNSTEVMESLCKEEDCKPDVILLDLKLPKLNGKQLLKMLKENPRTKKIPVIVTTTSSAPSDRDETIRLGAAAFMSKPKSLDEYKDYINDIERYM